MDKKNCEKKYALQIMPLESRLLHMLNNGDYQFAKFC